MISCGDGGDEDNIIAETIATFSLSVTATEGGSVDYNNPTGGIFLDGDQVNVKANADTDHYFIGWSNGSKENPIQISVNSNIFIRAKFINKKDLITRFDQIVIGNGENGPRFTVRWKQMKVFLEGTASTEFNNELLNFINELNLILDNDNEFSSSKVEDFSESNVHVFVTDANTYKETYPDYENISLEDYWGYAGWLFNDDGNIYSGNVFVNSSEMLANNIIQWTISHELGHILGLKHTEDNSSIMHQYYREGVNDLFSDLDKEALKFLHDERMTVFSDSDKARSILEEILGINSGKTLKNNSNTDFTAKFKSSNIVFACSKN
tara:strand:- start:7698 stop:8666 length:969 start_codon:yes stop_codon:yes gene_type:complete